jgi:dihydrofolate reductase
MICLITPEINLLSVHKFVQQQPLTITDKRKFQTTFMRTITFTINISLDGYCDHTLFNPADELMDYFTATMDDVDLLFYGRVMYQLMFPYWENVAAERSGTPRENKFAEKLMSISRVVLSNSLTSGDEKTTIIHGNAAEELLKLKQQPGKKISVDSVSLLPELISADLIDEFHIVVHPALAGRGRPLLPAGSLLQNLDLELADKVVFESGCLGLRYLRKRS